MTDHTDIVERLSACADDPMWADHCEMSKATARKAAAEITRLRAEAEALRKDKAQLTEALALLLLETEDYPKVMSQTLRKANAAIDATKGTT